MKLYYFTGTGNSLYIAKEIAKNFNHITPVSITKAIIEKSLIKEDIIGLVFPVYYHNPPHLVEKFIKLIKKCDYFFMVATYGSDIGILFTKMKLYCLSRGLKLSAGFKIVMPPNYIPSRALADKTKEDMIIEAADKEIGKIIPLIKNKEKHFDKGLSFFGSWFKPGMKYQLVNLTLPKKDIYFTVNSDCNHCGICQKICPAQNINIIDNNITWNHHCQLCLACLQWCPQQAINWQGKTEGKKRYHHRDIKLEELMDH